MPKLIISRVKQRPSPTNNYHPLKSIPHIKQLFLILLLFATISQSFNIKELDVSADTYTIGTLAKYTIIYDRTEQNFGVINDLNSNQVPSTATLTLTVPSVYALDYTITLSAMVNGGPSTFPNYTISSNIITVNSLFTTIPIVSNVTIVIQNLRNPSPAIITDAFVGNIGIDYAEPIYLKSVIVLQPAQFQSCYMTFNPKFVNRTSSMVFTIVTKTQIPLNGGLLIQFPSNVWSEGTATSTTNYLPITTSMSCGNLSTNVKSTIQCVGTQNQNRISVSNLFSTSINSGELFSFEVKNFLSPPNNRPADLIKITSQDSSGNKINICSEYVTDLIPNEMITSKITITNGGLPLTVNQQYTIRFMFETIDAFALTDYFEIQFPSGSNFAFNPSVLSGGITLIRTNATYSTNILRSYMNPLLSVKNYTAPFTMFISAGTYTAPPSIESTGNFKISILRNGFPLQVGYQSLTPISTTLSGSLTGRGSEVVNKITSYTFSIIINDALSPSGKIRIRLPAQVQIGSNATACGSLTGTNMIDSPICVINLLSKTIELTSINSSSALIPAQTFTVVINNLVNPFSTAQTSTFEVRSFYRSTDASLVAIGTVAGFLSKQAIIDASNILIQSGSYKVLDTGVTYTVRLNVENDIDMGGSLNLFIPKPIFVNTAVLTSSCKRAVNTAIPTTTPCTLISEDGTGYLIKYSNPLSASGVTKGQYIIMEITGIITNPFSTSPASTFKVYTYAASGSIIAKIQSSLSIQMTEPTVLTSAIYTRDSSKNYDSTNYQFTIKQAPVMEIGAVIIIQFPSQILPNVSSTCGMTAPFINANLLCSLTTSSAIRITLPSSIPISSDTALTLTVSNVRNPTSFRPPGNFFIRTFTSGQTYRYAEGATSNKINNTDFSSFKQVTGYYTPGQLDTATTLSLSFQPAFEAPGYLQVSIPSTYFIVPVSLSCSQVANFNGSCTSVSSHTIRVSGQFTSNGLVTFQVNGFSSQIRPPSSTDYVKLISFTADNYQLDYSNNTITYVLDCTFPCRTCDSSNTALCKSCYSNSNITDKIIFDSNTGSCYSRCPDGKFENPTTLLCENCDLNCLTCEKSATFCTTCKQSSAFKYLYVKSMTEQICVSQCEQMMYPDTTKTPPTCVSCSTPCKTCNSLNFCLTCLDTYFFWNNTCTKSCPLGNTVGDIVTGNCQLCSTNCLTCTVTVDRCTSCRSPLILYNNQCITECLLPLVYRPEILTCGPCDAQCKTCQRTANNCTSCDPVSLFRYFFNSNCLQLCPDLYYETISSCALCSSLNRNCDYCFNSTFCEKCNLGFVAFGSDCLAVTPSGYVNISGTALSCQGDCATCEITRTNCTSCNTLNLLGNTCQTNCPATTIPLNKKCTPCTSPCRTCSENTNNCTSCNSTLVPTLYLIQNRCDIDCPVFYYTDNGTNRCLQCQTPCKKCTDLVTCITCQDNYFLYQGRSCISNCPSQFIGINKICEACTSPCKTCVDSTTKCLSCEQTHFFFNSTNKCVTDCGEGLYEEFLNRTCISCTSPCKTCANTTNTCLSCSTGILYNFQCILQCPKKMYNDTSVCQECPAQCSGCSSKVVCTNCTSDYVLYNSFCITKCPDTHAVILSGACTKCSSTNCHKCYDNDDCYNCVSDYSLLNGACLSVCPAGYVTNGTHCEEVLASTLQSTNSNMFPVPLSIATSVVLIACMMSKLQNHKTFLAGAVYSLLGIVETLALLYYIYLYYINLYADYPIGIYIAVGALGLLYVLNVFSIFQSIILCYDKKHSQWKDSSAMNKLYNGFSTLIGICISHKFKNLMFSRLFAFVVFSAPLDEVKKFKIFNIFSFISLISSGGAIFSVITIIKLADPKTQFFHACLDVLIVTGINILVAFFNVFKGEDFFNEATPQGLILNRVIFGDQDSYNAKISMDGNDIEAQEGQGYYSKIQHTLGSHQPFKFKESDQSRQDLHDQYDSDSLTNIEEKQFESVSVQAYDILNEKQPGQTGIDFSTLKVDQNDGHDNSKFTTIFQNEDKSIQNTIDYGRKKVDYSVQKYNDVSLVDRSMQRNQEPNNNDISIQYSNKNNFKDVSIQRSRYGDNQHDVSVQGSIRGINQNDISVQNSARYADQSGQYSFLQSQKGVQNMVMMNDRSMQQSVNNQSWGGQNTINVKDISVQKESQQIEYNEFDETLEQNDDTTLKNVDNIFYIDEEEEDIDEGLESLPQSSKKLMNTNNNNTKDAKTTKIQQQTNKNNRKTIARQQLAEQKQEDFDFPPEQIKSYQQQLEQKIIAKQKQLQRVRKEIEQKQKESIVKEKLMRQEKERVEKQMKETEVRNLMLTQKSKQEQQRLQEQLRKKQVQLIKQQQLKKQLLQQQEALLQQQKTTKQLEGKTKQLQDKSTMMRMIQQVDDATSIDHIQAINNQIQIDTDQQKQQTLRVVNQVEQATSMDDEQMLLKGLNSGVNNKKKKQNYEVDMNMYIKEKSEYEVNDESIFDEDGRSIKTKAKSINNRRKSTINNSNKNNNNNNRPDQYQKNRQVQVRSSRHPSLPLNVQSQQPFNMESINSNFNKIEKQPGKIRVLDDSYRRMDNQQQQNLEEMHNYIYQVEDVELDQEEQDSAQLQPIQHVNQSNVQTNKGYKINLLNRNNHYQQQPINRSSRLQQKQERQQAQQQQDQLTQQQIQQLPKTSKISRSPKLTTNNNQPKLILEESNADMQFHQQPMNQFVLQEHNQQLQELNDQYFDSSQDIPTGLVANNLQTNKHTQSDAQQYIARRKHKLLNQHLLQQEQQLEQTNAQNLADHEQLRKNFNDQRKKLQHSNSISKKPIPPENKETLHVNITKLNSYQIDKPNTQRSSNSISPQKKPTSLLANAAHNLVANPNQPNASGNDVLMKKSSSNRNPLVTQKKWQHENDFKNNNNNLHSIEQSSEGNNDSSLYQHNIHANNKPSSSIPKPISRRQPIAPTQTDKQETSFSNKGIKVGTSSHNLNNQPSSKSINEPARRKTSIQKMSARELLGQNSYNEQVEVHFETKQHQEQVMNKNRRNLAQESHHLERPIIDNQPRNNNPNSISRPNVSNTNSARPLSTSKQRPYMNKPPTKPGTVMKQYESQEIFGDEYQPSQEEYSEVNSFDKKISKQHRNNVIMDKMMERPDNDDLYDYYNRASTKKGSNNKRGSKQRRSTSKNNPINTRINLSKQKLQNDRQMEKIYMQRIDSSMNNQRDTNRSKSRY